MGWQYLITAFRKQSKEPGAGNLLQELFYRAPLSQAATWGSNMSEWVGAEPSWPPVNQPSCNTYNAMSLPLSDLHSWMISPSWDGNGGREGGWAFGPSDQLASWQQNTDICREQGLT